MPNFLRIKGEDGHFHMVEAPAPGEGVAPMVIPQPAGATLAGAPRPKKYLCIACTPPKPFAGLGVMSMHFSRHHKELMQDKDTWRKFVGTVGDEKQT